MRIFVIGSHRSSCRAAVDRQHGVSAVRCDLRTLRPMRLRHNHSRKDNSRKEERSPWARPLTNADRSIHRTSVLIAGAGPTGLALACDLRGRGIDVTIIDKAPGPATTSRALGLQPRGTEILARLGALGDLPQRAVKVQAMNFYSGERPLFRIEMRSISRHSHNRSASYRAIRNRGAAAGATGRTSTRGGWGTELVAAEEDKGDIKVTVRSKAGEYLVSADRLVGCDGSHSKTRKLAGIAFDGTAFAEKFLLADVRLDWSRPRREPVSVAARGRNFCRHAAPGTGCLAGDGRVAGRY